MRVIIIGAGIAGLSAALRLIQLGIEVVILEGRNRSGGRVCKADEFDIPIDLGASWIHGVVGNPLAAVAERLNVKLDVTDNPSLTSSGYFEIYDEDGHLVDPETETKMRDKFEELTKVGRQFMDALGKDLPLESVLQLEDDDKLSKKERRFFNWLKSGIEGWENTNLSNLSARGHYWENENQFSGGDGFVIDGFHRIVHHLAADLHDRKAILLDHEVERVEYDDNSVRVVTNRGTFAGDFAISTLPLGVLKAGNVEFSPALPKWKAEAIQRVGFGLMNKIVLEFPRVFWRSDVGGIGYVSDQRGEFNFVLNLFPFTNRPILMAFVAADFAHLMEGWTDTQILDKVMSTLRKIYRDTQIPEPTRHKITRWGSDRFARGSYSFLAYGSNLQDIERMADPVGPLHFAGEATHKPLGFTHGAFLSGVREAERIKERMRRGAVTPKAPQIGVSSQIGTPQPSMQLSAKY